MSDIVKAVVMAEHKDQEETPAAEKDEQRLPVPELKPESDGDREAPEPPRNRPRPRHNRESPPENDGSEWRRRSKTLAFWVFFVLVALFATRFFGSSTGTGDVVISYKEYRTLMKQGKIGSAVIIDSDFHGTLLEPEYTTSRGAQQAYRTFVVNLGVIGEDAIADWEKYEIDFRFQEKPFDWLKVFFNFLPWLLFVGLWLFIFRQMQGGPKGAFSFGKSRAKLVSEDRPKVTFKDVAGSDEAKQELQEIIEYLKDPRKFQRLGGRIPKGVLLVGPPGTGKTYMAKAVAGEAGVPFYSMSGSDFVEMFVGVGASRVRDLFEQGKANAPCIIFIDEIDAVGRHRGAGIGGGHDEREQTLNQLLVEMDGFDSKEGVILIAATNRPDVLDPALLRPGRFDRQVVVDRPDVKGREGVLKVHIRNTPLAKNVDLTVLARATPGFTQADLENLVNEAALLASRHDRTSVVMEDFENAKDKVIMGVERRSLVISDSEKKRTAYHEIGHALVAKLVPESDPVHKVTIIPRGTVAGPDDVSAHRRTPQLFKELQRRRSHIRAWWQGGGKDRLRGSFQRRTTGLQDGHRPRAPHGMRLGNERETGSRFVRQQTGRGLPRPRDGSATGLQRKSRTGDRRRNPQLRPHRRRPGGIPAPGEYRSGPRSGRRAS